MNKKLLGSVGTLAVIAGFMLPSAAMAAPVTYTEAAGLSITDSSTITSDLVIADTGSIVDLTVELNIEHTWIGDLIIQLTGPDGSTTIDLMDRPGNPTTTFGDSSNFTLSTPVIFDDLAATAAESAGELFLGAEDAGGSFAPDGLLSTFAGSSLAGTWTLSISDNADGDIGSLQSWSIHANAAAAVPEPEMMALFGVGLLGMGALRRRRKA